MKSIALTTLLLLSTLSIAADNCCLQWSVQTIAGTGGDHKQGFTCGTGCAKRYFLAETTSGSAQYVRDYSSDAINDSFHTVTVATKIFGSTGRYITITETGPCTRTITTNGPSSTAVDIIKDQYDQSGFYIAIGGYNNNCRFMSVGDDLIYHLVNGNEVGPGWSCVDEWSGGTLVKSTTIPFPCGPSRTIEEYAYRSGTETISATKTIYGGTGYADEYTTSTMIRRARGCAEYDLATNTFASCGSCSGKPYVSIEISGDNDTAAFTVSRWRLKLTGHESGGQYEIEPIWEVKENGKIIQEPRDIRTATAPNDFVWYYSSEQGEKVEFTLNNVDSSCPFTYEKKLLDVKIRQLPH